MPGPADEAGPAEEECRPLLFSIAYGMTAAVGDAEDTVQDAFLGLTRARQAGTTIADPKAYLAAAVTRLGINYLRSARVRRETYVADWLPGQLVVPADGPAEHAELADSLSMAFLVLLEALSPVERAVQDSSPRRRKVANRRRYDVRLARPRWPPDQLKARGAARSDSVLLGCLQGGPAMDLRQVARRLKRN